MKISELPPEIRIKAEKYRAEANQEYYEIDSDNLADAFNWKKTCEGYLYWMNISNDVSSSEKPSQYQIGIDTFERSEANMTKEEILACCRFNIDKYNWRKKDQDLSDFKKIIDYANFAIKQIEKND